MERKRPTSAVAVGLGGYVKDGGYKRVRKNERFAQIKKYNNWRVGNTPKTADGMARMNALFDDLKKRHG